MLYIKGAIIKQTILAALFSALSPMAWMKITKIIGKPAFPDKCSSESHIYS